MIAIIPARGGSKGLPGKNIKEMCDKPLIAYTSACRPHRRHWRRKPADHSSPWQPRGLLWFHSCRSWSR